MNKFVVKSCVTVSIPESFRKDLQNLTYAVERNSSVDITDVLNAILESNPEEKSWSTWDNLITVNFVDEK